jgi:hypothetical protein
MSESASSTDELSAEAELARLEAEAAEAKARAAAAAAEAARMRAKAAQRAPAVAKPAVKSAAGAPVAADSPTVKKSLPRADSLSPPTSPLPAMPPNGAAPAQAKSPAVSPVVAAPTVEAPGAAAPLPASGADMAAGDEPAEEAGRSWLNRSLVYSLGGWTTSMIVHMLLLIILATWMLPSILKPEPPLLNAIQERPQDELTQVLDQQTTPSTELAVSSQAFSGLPTGHAGVIEGSTEATFDREVAESVNGPVVNVGDVDFASVSGKALSMDVPEGAPGDAQAVVNNYQEAMDRITQEILMMLLKNKVLVVWLFDESESMKDDQAEIKTKVHRVYEELGLLKAAQGDAMLTAVCSFGEKWTQITKKPTYDTAEIREAIEKIGVDASGKEMLCQSVGQTVSQFKRFATSGQRQLAVILVTDESGDPQTNVDYLEAAIAEAKAARARIYVLGREAVFGYPYAQMRWTDPSTKINYWLQIDRGPETPAVEQLQTNGFYRRYDAHPSGFGPYEQARIARETGGIFFMLPSPEVNLVARDNRKYELEAMRPYMPDLSARDAYIKERDKVQWRRAMYDVIEKLNPHNKEAAPHIIMRHEFSIKPDEFLKQVRAEEEKAMKYILYLDSREKELEKLKSQRDKDPSPRWRANYDLIFAQIIAYKVRMYEYGAYLEDFIKNPKPIKNPQGPNKKTTNWELTTRQKMLTEAKTGEYVKRSKELFAAVIKDHAGTPWAARAEWELKRGFGVDLVEEYDDPRRYKGVKLPKL